MDYFADAIEPPAGVRHQTIGEEIANSISHGAGALAALSSMPILVARAVERGEGRHAIAGGLVFGACMCILYLGSAIYHALPHGRAKRAFQVIEHMAIYFMIAGTYTPFMLGVLRGPLGTGILWAVWLLTGVGVLFKLSGGVRFPRLSTALYVLMGWLVVIGVGPLWRQMPHAGFYLLAAGGFSYMLGVLFYVRDNHWRYGHFIWHLFVLAGTACHFCAVLWYAG